MRLPLHPAVGWIDPQASVEAWSNAQVFLGAMALLQLMAAVLNLLPIPPLDGFGIIAPFLPPHVRQKAMTPPISTFMFIGLFVIIFRAAPLILTIFKHVLLALGFGEMTYDMLAAYGLAIRGPS